ncbi:MAG TPA: hypothetical protein VGC72_18895 [Candidatus Elarobacter sp.]|jgi:hypothetical protein
MTIDEVLLPVMLPVACGLTLVAVLFFFWHVGRRYPSAPKNVPLRLRIDGRPGQVGSKRWLWFPPAVVAAVAAVLGVVLPQAPGAAEQRTTIALVFLTIAEVAVFGAWQTDRQIELARKMTYRIAPLRTLRVFFPILVTIVVTVVVAIRP